MSRKQNRTSKLITAVMLLGLMMGLSTARHKTPRPMLWSTFFQTRSTLAVMSELPPPSQVEVLPATS